MGQASSNNATSEDMHELRMMLFAPTRDHLQYYFCLATDDTSAARVVSVAIGNFAYTGVSLDMVSRVTNQLK